MHDLAARNARAAALLTAGSVREAADMFEDTLRGCRALLGRDHHATLSVAGNLGAARVSAGRRREGIRLIAVNVADRSRVLGEEDPRTLTARAALAVAHRLQGDVDDVDDVAQLSARSPLSACGCWDPRTRTRSPPGREWRAPRPPQAISRRPPPCSARLCRTPIRSPRHPHRTALVECAEAIGMTLLEG